MQENVVDFDHIPLQLDLREEIEKSYSKQFLLLLGLILQDRYVLAKQPILRANGSVDHRAVDFWRKEIVKRFADDFRRLDEFLRDTLHFSPDEWRVIVEDHLIKIKLEKTNEFGANITVMIQKVYALFFNYIPIESSIRRQLAQYSGHIQSLIIHILQDRRAFADKPIFRRDGSVDVEVLYVWRRAIIEQFADEFRRLDEYLNTLHISPAEWMYLGQNYLGRVRLGDTQNFGENIAAVIEKVRVVLGTYAQDTNPHDIRAQPLPFSPDEEQYYYQHLRREMEDAVKYDEPKDKITYDFEFLRKAANSFREDRYKYAVHPNVQQWMNQVGLLYDSDAEKIKRYLTVHIQTHNQIRWLTEKLEPKIIRLGNLMALLRSSISRQEMDSIDRRLAAIFPDARETVLIMDILPEMHLAVSHENGRVLQIIRTRNTNFRRNDDTFINQMREIRNDLNPPPLPRRPLAAAEEIDRPIIIPSPPQPENLLLPPSPSPPPPEEEAPLPPLEVNPILDYEDEDDDEYLPPPDDDDDDDDFLDLPPSPAPLPRNNQLEDDFLPLPPPPSPQNNQNNEEEEEEEEEFFLPPPPPPPPSPQNNRNDEDTDDEEEEEDQPPQPQNDNLHLVFVVAEIIKLKGRFRISTHRARVTKAQILGKYYNLRENSPVMFLAVEINPASENERLSVRVFDSNDDITKTKAQTMIRTLLKLGSTDEWFLFFIYEIIASLRGLPCFEFLETDAKFWDAQERFLYSTLSKKRNVWQVNAQVKFVDDEDGQVQIRLFFIGSAKSLSMKPQQFRNSQKKRRQTLLGQLEIFHFGFDGDNRRLIHELETYSVVATNMSSGKIVRFSNEKAKDVWPERKEGIPIRKNARKQTHLQTIFIFGIWTDEQEYYRANDDGRSTNVHAFSLALELDQNVKRMSPKVTDTINEQVMRHQRFDGKNPVLVHFVVLAALGKKPMYYIMGNIPRHLQSDFNRKLTPHLPQGDDFNMASVFYVRAVYFLKDEIQPRLKRKDWPLPHQTEFFISAEFARLRSRAAKIDAVKNTINNGRRRRRQPIIGIGFVANNFEKTKHVALLEGDTKLTRTVLKTFMDEHQDFYV